MGTVQLKNVIPDVKPKEESSKNSNEIQFGSPYGREILPDDKKVLFEEDVNRGLISFQQPIEISSQNEQIQQALQQQDFTKPFSVAAHRPIENKDPKRSIRTFVRTVPPIIGGTIGAIAGIPTGGAASPVLSGLGFAAGGELSNLLGLEEDQPLRQDFERFKQSATMGMVGEKVGTKGLELIGKGLGKAGNYIFDDLPKKLYGRALATAKTKEAISTANRTGKSIIEKTVEEGLSSGVPVTREGLKQAESNQKEVLDYFGNMLKKAGENKEYYRATSDIKKSLKNYYEKIKYGTKEASQRTELEEIEALLDKHGESLSPEVQNKIKVELRDELKKNSFLGAKQTVADDAKQALTNDLMFGLEKIGGIQETNQNILARSKLVESIRTSLDKHDAEKLVGSSGQWYKMPYRKFENILFTPEIKSRIALYLAKSNPERFSKFIYPEMPSGYVPEIVKQQSPVYRYQPETQYVKSKTPDPLKTKLWDAEPEVKIKTRKELQIEQDEEIRRQKLEKYFRDQQYTKKESKTGSPLEVRRETQYVKSKTPNLSELLRMVK